MSKTFFKSIPLGSHVNGKHPHMFSGQVVNKKDNTYDDQCSIDVQPYGPGSVLTVHNPTEHILEIISGPYTQKLIDNMKSVVGWPKKDCPECKGTGQYIGFNKIEKCCTCFPDPENCDACDGTGVQPSGACFCALESDACLDCGASTAATMWGISGVDYRNGDTRCFRCAMKRCRDEEGGAAS